MGPDTMKLFTIIIVLYSSSLSYSLSMCDTNIIGISILMTSGIEGHLSSGHCLLSQLHRKPYKAASEIKTPTSFIGHCYVVPVVSHNIGETTSILLVLLSVWVEGVSSDMLQVA